MVLQLFARPPKDSFYEEILRHARYGDMPVITAIDWVAKAGWATYSTFIKKKKKFKAQGCNTVLSKKKKKSRGQGEFTKLNFNNKTCKKFILFNVGQRTTP